MKYQQTTFTLPVNTARMSDLEYALRVGKISPEEFDLYLRNVLPNTPAKESIRGRKERTR